MKIIDVVQGTPEWHACRLGRLTGSRVAEAFATRKDKTEAAGRRNTRIQLVLERLTGKPQDETPRTADMERGSNLEWLARAAYEAQRACFVEQVGFIAHDTLMAGTSPDGLMSGGGLELKCPKAATHLDYVRGGLPNEYFLQCVHGLWLTGLAWWDFASFHPEFPEPLQLKVTRIYAKDVDLKAHDLNVSLFLSEVEKEEAAVRELIANATVAA